jgi:hypothetical protein
MILAVYLAGCGSTSSRVRSYAGHTRDATVVLTIRPRHGSRPPTWTLSMQFTPAGARLRRAVHTSLLNAFCFGRTLVEAGVGPAEIRTNSVELTRAPTFPVGRRVTCGLRDSNPAKSRAAYLATALLAVPLARQ